MSRVEPPISGLDPERIAAAFAAAREIEAGELGPHTLEDLLGWPEAGAWRDSEILSPRRLVRLTPGERVRVRDLLAAAVAKFHGGRLYRRGVLWVSDGTILRSELPREGDVR